MALRLRQLSWPTLRQAGAEARGEKTVHGENVGKRGIGPKAVRLTVLSQKAEAVVRSPEQGTAEAAARPRTCGKARSGRVGLLPTSRPVLEPIHCNVYRFTSLAKHTQKQRVTLN